MCARFLLGSKSITQCRKWQSRKWGVVDLRIYDVPFLSDPETADHRPVQSGRPGALPAGRGRGRVYVGTETGKVVCIDAGDKKFTGWPCWGGNAAHTGVPVEEGKK